MLNKKFIIRNLSNLPGWRTSRKIVVIESDDWGSIRMPSLNAFHHLKKEGLDLTGGDAKRYNQNDTLASNNDLVALFETLLKFRDNHNAPPVFTAVSVVANPDFKKIKNNGFKEYYYEPFTKTLQQYYGTTAAFDLWKEGINNKIFIPQFHAREHLNIGEWMRALQAGDKQSLVAFDQGLWGFNNKRISASSISFQAVFDLHKPTDLQLQAETIKSGLALFETLFGYKATFFVPPNGPFNNRLEEVAADAGIKYMSASKMQIEPQGLGKNKRVFHWLGQKNRHGQVYITRNCFFEPSQEGKDWVSACLREISIAFRWHKPAIISSHRVNYIGELSPANRRKGVMQLSQLLQAVLRNWPDVEFCSTDELGDIIVGSKEWK